MRLLFVPVPPKSVRDILEAHCPEGIELRFCSEDDPSYDSELAEAEVLFGVPRKRLDASLLERAPKLKLIQQLRKGVDKVDLPAMKEAGVAVATIGDLTAQAVAEHTLMLMLNVCHMLQWQHETVQDHRWAEAKPWQLPAGKVDTVPDVSFTGLEGLRLGLFGMGNIGTRTGRLAEAFGMEVRATTRSEPGTVRDGIQQVSLDELLETSDVLSLHLVLTDETRGVMDAERLAQMKKGSYLINTARGQLVDEAALAAALDRKHILGAGLDTLSKEPPPADHPLLGRPDVLVTPHSGWLGQNSWSRCIRFGYQNVEKFRNGEELGFRAV